MHDIFSFLIVLSSILFFAMLFGEFALKLGQSVVMGELIVGIIMGPSVLAIINETQTLSNISELGAMILLFEVGLSTNIKKFLKSSGWASAVAIIGVVLPYFFGYFGFLLFGFTNSQAIFAASALTATSVGITAKVFMDLQYIETEEAEIVLGAAIIDDIIGLTILAIVSRLITNGTIDFKTIASISGYAILFLISSIVIGILVAPTFFKFISKMKRSYVTLIVGIVFCFIVSSFSIKAKLAPIVGAFIAGLILSVTKQKEKINKEIKPISAFFVPIFFVMMGINIDVSIFNPFVVSNMKIWGLVATIFIVALVGKILSGFIVFKKGIDKFLIGISMVPRGEVGLIFAGIGLQTNVFKTQDYSALIAVIMLTTFITPMMLKYLILKKKNKR
ncbi:MAG: cation:proton antiporter [Endomicrobium sp.]|jgi:Kef-type K+ transport system membrane component KefB|nr:cation:proton antiporter [Endomicrobium sp.]